MRSPGAGESATITRSAGPALSNRSPRVTVAAATVGFDLRRTSRISRAAAVAAWAEPDRAIEAARIATSPESSRLAARRNMARRMTRSSCNMDQRSWLVVCSIWSEVVITFEFIS